MSGKIGLFQLCNLWVMHVHHGSLLQYSPYTCSTVLQGVPGDVIYWYCNTLCQRAMQGVGVPGDVIYGYCLWRGGHDLLAKLGPCIVVDPTGHTCKLQSASRPLPLSSTSWIGGVGWKQVSGCLQEQEQAERSSDKTLERFWFQEAAVPFTPSSSSNGVWGVSDGLSG